jgi:hypothetical protein
MLLLKAARWAAFFYELILQPIEKVRTSTMFNPQVTTVWVF